jgi:hypothetical protein
MKVFFIRLFQLLFLPIWLLLGATLAIIWKFIDLFNDFIDWVDYMYTGRFDTFTEFQIKKMERNRKEK